MSTKMKLSAESNFLVLACVLRQGLGRFSPLHRSWSLCFRPRYTMPSNCWHMDLESPRKPAISTPPLLCPDPATPLLNSCLSNDSGLFRPLKRSHSERQRAKANVIKTQSVTLFVALLPPRTKDFFFFVKHSENSIYFLNLKDKQTTFWWRHN